MKSTLSLLLLCIGLWFFSSCASKKPYYQNESDQLSASQEPIGDAEIAYSLFMTGGLPVHAPSPTLRAVLDMAEGDDNGLVLLGDVVSIDDLAGWAPEELDSDSSPVSLVPSLDEHFKDLFLLPGQKEWSSSKKVTTKAIRSLDRALKDVKDKGRLMEPAKGCGTPEVVRLTDRTILVLVDSQWAIEVETHPGEKLAGCELANILEWRQALKDIIQSYPSDHIIIATHHPVYANGLTAGNYPLSSHLLPLPVLGTLITAVKTLVSSNQHFGHPAYEAYRDALISAVESCKNCVIVSGHEKSLQYYQESDQHYFVAGSGYEFKHARKKDQSVFSYMSRGFVRIDELLNGNLRISMLAVNENNGVTKVLGKELTPARQEESYPDEYTDINSENFFTDSVVMPASELYSEKKFLRGEFYREAWSKPITIPVMWLDSVYGGLDPLQLGGGNQTRSLRLENEEKEQYVIRSIDKKVTAVLPPALRGTFAENIVQDGIAASHPYGALVIPKLAEAAGVYYTNPSVVYVPHQQSLGIYNKEVGDGVYIMEERPGGNTSSFSNFGNALKTINSYDLLELMAESPEHIVDQKSVLRARLFDIWLGDWDRHDDQWRWAAFEEKDKTIYKPIPRDRDQVFYKNDGLLDYMASRPYFNPPLRRFTDTIDYLPGLVWAGKYFDRSFLHTLSEEDFIEEARQLTIALTDEVIARSFLDWPAEIDSLNGEDIRSFLLARRDDLESYARMFYAHLSKEVFIPGSDDHDVMVARVIDDDHLRVTATRESDDGDTYLFFDRTFNDKVTKEIRLFGLSKRDTFIMEGSGRPSILIRTVGGTGEDILINQTDHLEIKAYDSEGGMAVSGGPVSEHLNDKPFNNTFDRTDWKLNKRFHFPSPAYFTDEGFGLSYNFWVTKYGFRSDPYKSRQSASVSYFFNEVGFIGKYSGEWLNAFGEVDFSMDAFVTGPTFTQYYYGLGNNYVDYGEKSPYHIVEGTQIILSPAISRRFGIGSSITLRPAYHYLNLKDSNDEDRFVYTPEAGLSPDDFGRKDYVSVFATYNFERLDNAGFPTRGAEMTAAIGTRASVSNGSYQHGLFSFQGSLYIPFDVSGTFVLATHVGAESISGDYEFFHALTLGGKNKLRGFNADRFAGNARFYQATDLRIKLFKKQGVVPFSFGIYGSFDYGRVWYEEDDSSADHWHTSLGGGIFIVPFSFTAFRLGYMAGENDQQINIGGALRF